jgi:hypothetical protein
MKIKLTTLLFGLLLAVGWTSSAFAQSSPNNIPDAVHNRAYYDALTYTWDDPTDNEGPITSSATDLATNPYQIYELLRFVYGNPAFPGPRYAAYNYSGIVREDPVSYAPVGGCWNIQPANNPRDIKITINQYSGNYPVYLSSIQVKSGDKVLDSWTYNSIVNRFLPTNWFITSGYLTLPQWSNNNDRCNFTGSGGSFTIPAGLLEDYTDIQVVIRARSRDTDYSDYKISVNGSQKTLESTSFKDYTWNLTLPAKTDIPFVQGTVATPYEEGYTALMVSVKNEATPATETTGGSYFANVTEFANYAKTRIKSVQLLTDGLRIGNVDEHTSGTVFNCAGTYNKFFIISKGQAREIADRIKYNYSYKSDTWYYGEAIPFQQMFEQFSPTVTDKGAEINDFYSEMQDGHVYSVVHDCGTVIQEEHQFSMSGNNDTTAYAMSGLNFFIPDYRLLFWKTTSGRYTVDGRDITPYQEANDQGKYLSNASFGTNTYWNSWWANYNPDYAPKIGIYKIELEANAKKSSDYADENGKRNFDVTLNWVSSLNEMTGDMVPQTYEIYIVDYQVEMDTTYNDQGDMVLTPTGAVNEVLIPLDTIQDETSYTYQVPQKDESYTITYVIKGYPTPEEGQEYPSFVAWSNLDDVVIPGLSDFLALILDHYESDFVIGKKLGEEQNYYRNFLHVTSDDEGEKALTRDRIKAGEDEFKLWRYDVTNPNNKIHVGTLTFLDRNNNETVGYGFTFEPGQEVEYYHLQKPALYKENENHQQVLVRPAIDIDSAYLHRKLGMPMNNAGSDLRLKGNGDLIIQPNDYAVNFKEISVYNANNTRVAHWQESDGDLPNGWYLSPGSRWLEDYGDDYYYLEGGGYIAIPGLMTNNDQLRVVINAFGDAGNITTIAVNDHSQNIKNETDKSENAQDYTWNVDSRTYKYVKVSSASDLTNGEYLIVCETKNVAFNGNAGTLDAASNNINVTILNPESANAEIASSPLVDNAVFTIVTSAGTSTIKSNSGYYIGWTANSGNGLRQNETEQIPNAISFDGIVAHIKTVGLSTTRELRFNNAQGQKRFRYYPEDTQEPIQLYKKVVDTEATSSTPQIVRLGALPIVDQFTANVSKNDHPARYAYVLTYTPKAGATGEAAKAKQSSIVEVPVQHTGSAVNGYYTEDTVKKDEDRKLKLDIMSGDVEMTLSDKNKDIFYYTIVSSNNVMPKTEETYYVSHMQNDNFTYEEMWGKSAGKRYPAGEHHYLDSIPATGSYSSSYKTYVPYITQMAISRYYYASDSLNNTYGSPVWATAVGKVDNVSANVQPQQGWNTTWTDNGNCRLYMLDNVMAEGYLPLNIKDGDVLSNIEYEPYMFRIFVESPNGKLRHFKTVTDDNGNEVIAADEGSTEGPWCVWSEYLEFKDNGDIKDNPTDSVKFGVSGNVITFEKKKVERTAATEANPNPEWDKDANNAIFGALTSIETGEGQTISADDLKIYVRFYYKSTGKPIEIPTRFMLRADGADADKSFYAVEGAATAKQGPTAVEEILYHGEIVSQTYFNVQGMESDKPFDGINIVVTRYSDGATSVSKVVR